MVTKRSHMLKQTCSWKLNLFVTTRLKGLKQFVRQILFISYFMSFRLTILNLTVLSKINLQWLYWLFSIFSCKTFKSERPWMNKLTFKHLNKVFGIFWFFGILKIPGFVFVKINLIVYLQSWRNMLTYFAKHALILLFYILSSPFLSTFPICLKEET